MKIAWTIAIKDIREAFRNKYIYFYIAILLFIAFPYLESLRNSLTHLEGQGAADQAAMITSARSFLNNTINALPLTLSMLFCTYLSAYAIVLEKAKRTLESLLATPASLRQVWIGKSLAVSLPSIAVTYLVLILVVLVSNYTIIMPKLDTFILPGVLPIITGLLIVPLVTFSVVCIVSIFQLTMTNPRLANMFFMIVFFGFYFMTVTGFSATWDLSLIYLVILGALIVITLGTLRFLTKERVVLSSKG
jgi:ABC-2 type transport system permease protein